jgi:hypothetical protein
MVVDIGVAPDPGPAPAPVGAGRFQTGKGSTAAAREKLGAEESAAIRTELIREIETLPEEELQSRAIAILKAKNRLFTDDAKCIQDAFAARMAPQGSLLEALAADEATPAPSGPAQPPPTIASTGPAKPPRPRGRPRKVKAATEQSGPPSVISKPIDDNLAPALTHIQNEGTSSKIDKSLLTSAKCVGSATRRTSSSWRRSPVWFAGEVPLTPTICGSPSLAQWDARSATSSRYRCAEPITGTITVLETKSPG